MILVAAAVSSLFLAAAVLAATFVLLKHQSVAVLRKLPGPKPNFLFGNALQLARLPDGKYKPILHLIKTKRTCKLAPCNECEMLLTPENRVP